MTERSSRPSGFGWLAILAAVLIGAVAVVLLVLRPWEAPFDPIVLDRPAVGEVRPDYLPDGTPVWVIGHDNGDVSVLSGFDAHTPFGLNKMLWWCERADALDNPHHGSKYDEYGLRIGGPAPQGLATYAVVTSGARISVGALRDGAPAGTPHSGPHEVDREWCLGLDDGTSWHTFEGWRTWDSPTAAVGARPSGWILLSGALVGVAGEVRLCALAGCEDSVHVTNVGMPPDPNMEFGPFEGERFIAQVRDGALDGVTRVLPASAP